MTANLQLISFDAPSSYTLDSSNAAQVSWQVINSGDEEVPNDFWFDSVYLSADETLDGSDTLLDFTAPFAPSLAPTETYTVNLNVSIPNVEAGPWFLIVSVDDDHLVDEQSEGDNILTAPLSISLPDADLTSQFVSTVPLNVEVNAPLTVSWEVTNTGSDDASATRTDRIYLSTDDFFDFGDAVVYEDNRFDGVPANGTVSGIATLNLPADLASGTYFLFVVADDNNDQSETDEFNNGNAVQLNIVEPGTGVDLVTDNVDAPAVWVIGTDISVGYFISNLGDQQANGSITQSIYLSYDDTFDPADDQLLTRDDLSPFLPIDGGNSASTIQNFTLNTERHGNQYLLIVTDALANIAEDDESNNVLAVPVKVVGDDLVVTDTVAPSLAGVGATVQISFDVTNNGLTPSTSDYWQNAVFLSTDDVLDEFDLAIGSQLVYHGSEAGPLSPQSTDHYSFDWLVPNYPLGNYYLLFSADFFGEEPELDEGNNVVVQPIEIAFGADLTVSDVSVASPILLGGTADVSYTISNVGVATADPAWFEQIYMSDDNVFDSSDVLVDGVNYAPTAALAPGESVEVTRSITFRQGVVGQGKYLFVRIGGIPELNSDNNVDGVQVDTVAPDISLSGLTVPSSVVVSQQANVSWSGQNIGSVPALSNFSDIVYFSTDATYDLGDTLLANASFPDVTPLDPSESYSRSLNVTIPRVAAGVYYLIIRGAANSQPDSDLSNNVLVSDPITVTVPDLVVTDLSAPASAVLGDTINVSYTVTNQSTSPTGGANYLDGFYLSDDPVYQATDTFLMYVVNQTGIPLAAGASYTKNIAINLNQGSPGAKYLIIRTDAGDQQGESDNTNNSRAIAIDLSAPDLVITSATVPEVAAIGKTIAVSFVVKNNGSVPAPATWTDSIFLSSDPDGFVGNFNLANIQNTGKSPLAPGDSYTVNANITIPAGINPASMYLRFQANNLLGRQPETDNTNNKYVVPIEIVRDAVNLDVTSSTIPSTIVEGNTTNISWTVKNTGTAATFQPWFDYIFFSTDATYDGSDQFILTKDVSGVGSLAAGASYTLSGDLYFQNIAPGQYYILVVSDISNSQPETNELDNVFAVPVQFVGPDLVVDSVIVPSSATLGTPFDVTYTVRNAGTAAATGAWNDRIIVTTDSGQTVTFLQDYAIPPATLAAGATYTRTVSVTVGANFPGGDFRVGVGTDINGQRGETDEGNNSRVSDNLPMTLPGIADLVVSSIVVPAQGFLNQKVLVNWTITNAGTSTASGPWYDRLEWQSASNFFTVGNFLFDSQLAPGASITRTQVIDLPPVAGTYSLKVMADVFNQVPEGGVDDNTTLSGSIVTTQAPLPDLTVTSIVAPADGILSGQPVQVTFTVKNQGVVATNVPDWSDFVLFSQDPNLTFGGFVTGLSDQIINNQPYRAVPFGNPVSLAPGESYSQTVTLPLLDDQPGVWYAYVAADGLGSHFSPGPAIRESDESNNFLRSAGFTVTQGPTANLEVTSASAISAAFSGQPIELTWTTSNTGPAPTHTADWIDSVYLSTDATFDASDFLLGNESHGEVTLPSGQSYSVTRSYQLPVGIAGTYYLLVVTDSGNSIFELPDEQDNVGATAAINVSLTPPSDLVVQNLLVNGASVSGGALSVSFAVTNEGATQTEISQWTDGIYLSTTPTLDSGSVVLLKQVERLSPLPVGGTYFVNTTVEVPDDVVGNYFIVVVVDNTQSVFELDRSDNSAAVPLFIQFQPSNLVVANLVAPATGLAGGAVTAKWAVTNTGIGATGSSIWDDVVLYVDDNPQTDDIVLATVTHFQVLAAGASYFASASFQLPADLSGSGHIVVVTDFNNDVFEDANEDDNSASSNIQVTPSSVDLVVSDVVIPASIIGGDSLSVDWTVLNAGAQSASGSWLDDIYLSTDAFFDSGDTLLKTLLHEGGLASGASYSSSADVDIPITVPTGQFYILVRTDHPTSSWLLDPYVNRVFEQNAEDNNVTALALSITTGPTVDLVTSAVSSPSIGYQQGVMTVSWTVTNVGSAATDDNWLDAVYLSYDQVFDQSSDILLDYFTEIAPIDIGGSYTRTMSVHLKNAPLGPAYIFVVTDATNTIFERTGAAGNVAYNPASISIQPAPPIDLVVGDITIPANGVAGTNVSLTYSVLNNSPNAAVGQWTDAIYLSTDGTWDLGDVLLGRVTHTTGVGAGQSYTETLSAMLPGVDPGLYHIILRTDAKSQIVESNESNNITASLDSINIDVPALIAGEVTTSTVALGDSRYYKIDVPANQTLRFALTGAAASSGVLLFASFGSLPSTSDFDSSAVSKNGKAEIVIPSTSEGTYYILITTTAVASLDFSIQADVLPFGITSISNSVGGAGGSITLSIEGAGFTTGTALELRMGDVVLIPTWMYIADAAHIYATFDLAGKPLGKYDVHVYTDTIQQVVDPSTYEGAYITVRADDATLEQGFEIVSGQGSHLDSYLIIPPSVLANRVFPFQFVVTNTGDNDVEAPVYLVDSSTLTPLSLSPVVTSETPTWEQFVVAGGRRRTVLAPGESVTVTLYALASSNTSMRFDQYLQSTNLPTDPINWDELESYYRDDQTDDVWASTWSNFTSLVGTSWESLYQAIRLSAADQLGYIGATAQAVSAGELTEDLLLRAESGQSDSSGFYYQQAGRNSGFQVETAPIPPAIVSSEAFAALRMMASAQAKAESITSEELDRVEDQMRNQFGPFFKAGTFSFDVANVFDNFLNGSSSNKPLPQIFRNGSDSVEGTIIMPGFKNSPTTITLFNDYVIPLIRQNIQKQVDQGKIGKAGGTFKVDMFSEGSDFFPKGFGDFKFNFSNNADIPGYLAGGSGGSPYGRDTRKIEGTVTLIPKTDKCGHTTLDAKFDLRMQVDDSFDFVDGFPGGPPLVRDVVAQLRLLEANDRAYAVPISAQWNEEIEPIPKVAVVPDKNKKPPKQPPKDVCLNCPPDPDCNAGPSAAKAGGGGSGCPDNRHDNGSGGGADPRTPNDPNDITGPGGYGQAGYIASTSPLAYTIHFENQASATAAARSIVITTQLDDDLDWSSFRLGDIGFSNKFLDLPGTDPFYSKRLDLTASRGIFVDVSSVIDVTTGIVTWTLTAIDPATGEPPTDPDSGILPPNEADGIGEGFVTFFINAKHDATTGDRIDAQATIIFDSELPISTPAIFNTIDAGAPTSAVVALPATSGPDFVVNWSGIDDAGGSGVVSYDIYVSVDGGAFGLWLENATSTSAVYHGDLAKTYAFYSIAIDGVGNPEVKSSSAEATTTIDVGLSINVAGHTDVVRYEAASYSFSVSTTAPGISTAGYILGVDWNNDGAIDNYSINGDPLTIDHAFDESTNVIVTFFSTDFTVVAQKIFGVTVTVSGAIADPTNPAVTNLYWTGTANDDHVRFTQTGESTVTVESLASDGIVILNSATFTGINGEIRIFAGAGNDLIDASGVTSLAVRIDAGDGNDTILGGGGDDIIEADGAEGRGNDSINGGGGNDAIHADGPEGNDPAGTFGNDVVNGGQGNDIIYGDSSSGKGNDVINGDEGNDLIVADGAEGKTESAAPGNDTITGGIGSDVIIAGTGADNVSGDSGSDLIIAGSTTTFDMSSLQLIQSEWLSARPLEVRANNLLDLGVGPRNNGNEFITPANTKLDDNAIDTIFGGDDEDWLLVDADQDDLGDYNPLEDLLTDFGV